MLKQSISRQPQIRASPQCTTQYAVFCLNFSGSNQPHSKWLDPFCQHDCSVPVCSPGNPVVRVSCAIWITLETSSHMTLYPSAFRHWKFSHRMTKIKLLPSRGQCTSDAALAVCLCVRLCNGDNLYNQARHAYGDDSRSVPWWVPFLFTGE